MLRYNYILSKVYNMISAIGHGHFGIEAQHLELAGAAPFQEQ